MIIPPDSNYLEIIKNFIIILLTFRTATCLFPAVSSNLAGAIHRALWIWPLTTEVSLSAIRPFVPCITHDITCGNITCEMALAVIPGYAHLVTVRPIHVGRADVESDRWAGGGHCGRTLTGEGGTVRRLTSCAWTHFTAARHCCPVDLTGLPIVSTYGRR